MRWTGAAVLGVGLLVLALSLWGGSISRALLLSVAALIYCGALVYSATRSEITGEAVYHHNFLMRHGWRTERVTRGDSPAEFREATDARWALSIFCALVSVGAFVFYRKAENLDDF